MKKMILLLLCWAVLLGGALGLYSWARSHAQPQYTIVRETPSSDGKWVAAILTRRAVNAPVLATMVTLRAKGQKIDPNAGRVFVVDNTPPTDIRWQDGKLVVTCEAYHAVGKTKRQERIQRMFRAWEQLSIAYHITTNRGVMTP